MRASTKWLIVSIILIVLGAGVFFASASALHFDFSKLSTVKYKTSTFEVKETFEKISIENYTDQIEFVRSENETCVVTCKEQEDQKHLVSVENGTLMIRVEDERKWFNFVGFFAEKTKITVALPEESYENLSIKTETGDVVIPEDFSFEDILIQGSTADVDCKASVSRNLEIRLNTGDITLSALAAGDIHLTVSTGDIRMNGVRCDDTITIGVSTGKVKMADVTCKKLNSTGSTGDLVLRNVVASDEFRLERDTGDIEFDGCDAESIFVTTTTGDVTGTLLSEKVFITETDTGSVKVPKSITGGRCEITTDTGKIEIEIQ